MSSDLPDVDPPSPAVGRNGVQLGGGATAPKVSPAVAESAVVEPTAAKPTVAKPTVAKAPLSRRPAQQWPLLVVLAGVVIGLGFCLGEQWRLGCVIIGASMAVGAVERFALPRRNAGLLQVRSRGFDITVMLGLAVVIVALAVVVPPTRF